MLRFAIDDLHPADLMIEVLSIEVPYILVEPIKTPTMASETAAILYIDG